MNQQLPLASETDEAQPRASLPPVRVIRSERRTETVQARLDDGVLNVRIPAWMNRDEEQQFVDKVLARYSEKWRCAQVPLETRARELAARFGLPEPASIRWSSRQRVRWGSCSTGSGDIRISSRLADVPPWVLDHVIVHELAHLVCAGHSAEFHALVNRNPYAERAEGYLLAFNEYGPGAQRQDQALAS